MKTTRVDTNYSYKCQLSIFCSPSARQSRSGGWSGNQGVLGFLFHPQLHQSQAASFQSLTRSSKSLAERRKQRYLKVELAKTSITFRHYIIINDGAWIWKLEFTDRI